MKRIRRLLATVLTIAAWALGVAFLIAVIAVEGLTDEENGEVSINVRR